MTVFILSKCILKFSFEPLARSIKQAHFLVWHYATTVLLIVYVSMDMSDNDFYT